MCSIEWWHYPIDCPQTTPFFAFSTAIHSFVTGEPRDFKFGTLIYHSKSHPVDEKSSRGVVRVRWPVLEFYTPYNISAMAKARDFKFVHGSAMRSLTLVMSECFLSGRGQGHMSNFYIVDLENFATASLQYTGDICNSSVVSLFMTPIGQWKRLNHAMVECTCLIHTVLL